MKIVAQIVLGALAYLFGVVASGLLTGALRLPSPNLPPGMTEAHAFRNLMLAAPLLAAALIPLVRGLRGAWGKRLLTVAFLLFVCLGVNTVIEAAVFSNIVGRAGLTLTLQHVLPAILLAAVLTWPSGEPTEQSAAGNRFTPVGWSWRLLLGWLAFPVIYFIFGMTIAPIVMPYYRDGVGGLTIPAVDVILRTQLLRSALFLLASVPLVMLWRKSRAGLFVALGLAHAMLVGIFGLLQASWMPTVLRVTHSIEITFDSFAYAGVLVLSFARAAKAAQPETATTAAVGK